jgi:hypothetical protein
MPLNVLKIAEAVQGGLSPVCATCRKYWMARERGVPGDRCLSRDNCAGPAGGDDFHEYEGPMSDFSRWCFACGEEAAFGVQVHARVRTIGVCKNHVRMLAEIRPLKQDGTEADDAPKYLIKSKDGALTIREILGPEKPSLIKAILEVEDFYANKGGG